MRDFFRFKRAKSVIVDDEVLSCKMPSIHMSRKTNFPAEAAHSGVNICPFTLCSHIREAHVWGCLWASYTVVSSVKLMFLHFDNNEDKDLCRLLCSYFLRVWPDTLRIVFGVH